MSDPFHPYLERYAHPNGPGDQRPTALEVLQDNDRIGKWTDKVVLITGATSGIGIETARALHATGARIFITARDVKKGQSVVEDIAKTNGNDKPVEVIEVDLDSLDSVKNAAKEFLRKSEKLNILINNAGIMATPQSTTKDGFERQFGVNHLAHFTLTALLLPTLIKSSTPDFNSRVVFVSSSSHQFASIQWGDINLKEKYNPFLAYGQSKTANIWTANYIDRVYGPQGVHAYSLHPGGIWSGLQQYVDQEQVEKWKNDKETTINMLTPAQGAATSVWAASAKALEGNGGKYLTDCGIAGPATAAQLASTVLNNAVGPDAYNEDGENRLWEVSSKLTGVGGP